MIMHYQKRHVFRCSLADHLTCRGLALTSWQKGTEYAPFQKRPEDVQFGQQTALIRMTARISPKKNLQSLGTMRAFHGGQLEIPSIHWPIHYCGANRRNYIRTRGAGSPSANVQRPPH